MNASGAEMTGPLILIDTSSWIEALRRDGEEATRRRVRGALLSGRAAWCGLVRLELWNGARGEREKANLRELSQVVEELPMDDGVWEQACQLALLCRSQGVTAPPTDLAIASCAVRHKAAVEHHDKHFFSILKAHASNPAT